MAKKANYNCPSVSLEEKSIPKGEATPGQYGSKSVLAKIKTGGETRAPQFKLENLKKS